MHGDYCTRAKARKLTLIEREKSKRLEKYGRFILVY